MKTRNLIAAALLLIFAVSLIAVNVYAGGKLIKSTLVVDGKSISLETIRPEGRLHVELKPVISGTGWQFNDQGGDTIYIKGKPFKYFVRYEGNLYVNAAALGKLLDYQVSIEEGGDLINFFPKGGEATKGDESVEIDIRSKEKFPSEKQGYDLWKLKLRFRNKTETALISNTACLIMLKPDKNGYFSETSVTFSLKPDEETTIDRVYFLVPQNTEIEIIGLTNAKRNALIGKCRW